jgi:RNA polymerase sigma-70 factor (ECF subfamily)
MENIKVRTEQRPSGNLDQVPTWHELVAEHSGFVYSVAYRLTGNPADASDLAQDALLRARNGLVNYIPGSIRAWLARITTNLFYDRAKSRSRLRLEEAGLDIERPSTSPGPDEEALGAELKRVVGDALSKLGPEFRLAVALCDLWGLSYEEIASLTGWCLGTVRSRSHRGRSALRPLLEPYVDARASSGE